jgi:hypothetical protein
MSSNLDQGFKVPGVGMLSGLDVLASTNWWPLFHAYGRATDTPDQLRALLSEDPKARAEAIDHLWSAVIHQGTPWTATGPTALVVAALLADERIDRIAETRPALLGFLVGVTEIAVGAEARRAELERKAAAVDLDPFIDLEDDDSGPTENAFYDAIFDDKAAADAYYAFGRRIGRHVGRRPDARRRGRDHDRTRDREHLRVRAALASSCRPCGVWHDQALGRNGLDAAIVGAGRDGAFDVGCGRFLERGEGACSAGRSSAPAAG